MALVGTSLKDWLVLALAPLGATEDLLFLLNPSYGLFSAPTAMIDYLVVLVLFSTFFLSVLSCFTGSSVFPAKLTEL